MLGLVLAAGAGRRLRPWTDALPKALVPVGRKPGGEPRAVLDIALANFAAAGITEVAVVVGYRKEAVHARKNALEAEHGVHLTLIDNDRAEEWNNAYSLYCARELLPEGVLLANGDTVHPVSVQRALLQARGGDRRIVLAVDTAKRLGEEEMKVVVDPEKGVQRISKQLDPAAAGGEYIGLALIEPAAAEELTDALRTTFERDPQLYYEDGYQELIDRGCRLDAAAIGGAGWIEIDDHADLAAARDIARHC